MSVVLTSAEKNPRCTKYYNTTSNERRHNHNNTKNEKNNHQEEQQRSTMTHCMNCDCTLSNNRAIEEHLKYTHGILIQLATAHDHRAYCHVCHKHLGAPKEQGGGCCFTGSRRAMEKHLFEEHEIYMHEESR